MLKKTAFAILTLAGGLANAGTMGPVCEPGDVTVPCAATAWDVGITALYLRPAFDADQTYFNYYTNAQSHRAYRNESFDWGWGFKLEGSYHFDTGNDVNVNWYHFDDTTSKAYDLGAATALYSSTLRDKIRWDAVNFEFGQHVDFGERKNIRFHGGAQYASIKSDMNITNFLGNAGDYYNQSMKFNGFGPRAGMDMSYDWMHGFSMYANVAGSLLVGTSKFSTSYTTQQTSGTRTGSKNALVPEVEAKIGAKYAMAVGQGTVTLDGGWMWVNYFNALHSVSNAQGPTFAPLYSTSTPQETDFSMSGPYLGVKWVGNA